MGIGVVPLESMDLDGGETGEVDLIDLVPDTFRCCFLSIET